MMRFLLRLASAIFVEGLCERIALHPWRLGEPDAPRGRSGYPQVHYYAPASDISWTPDFGVVVGISGWTTICTAPCDVAFTVREAGGYAENR